MIVQFDEHFAVPVEEIYSYFKTQADWIRIFGFAGRVEDRGGGWFAIPLKSFPFPLVAKITANEPNALVSWRFRGFWRGEAEVRFSVVEGRTRVVGYERISVRWLFFLSPLVEKPFLEPRFRALWAAGWRRLRKRETGAAPKPYSPVSSEGSIIRP